MAVTAVSSGTKTADGTEQTLLSHNAAGTFTLHVDTNAMAAGDYVELRIKQIILTGGTARVAYFQSFSGAQPADDVIKVSVPIANELTDSGSVVFTLKQTTGTNRAYPWKVLTY